MRSDPRESPDVSISGALEQSGEPSKQTADTSNFESRVDEK